MKNEEFDFLMENHPILYPIMLTLLAIFVAILGVIVLGGLVIMIISSIIYTILTGIRKWFTWKS